MIRCLIVSSLLLPWLGLVFQDDPQDPVESRRVVAVAPASSESKASEQTASTTEPAADEAEEAVEFRPRFELFIPSFKHLVQRVGESHAGALARSASGLFAAQVSGGGGGLTAEELAALVDRIRGWSDTSLGLATFAPTAEGKARWVIHLDWPLEDLRERMDDILKLDATSEMLEGVTLSERAEGGYEIALNDNTLAQLVEREGGGSWILSDAGVDRPSALYGQDRKREDPPKATATLVYSRLNLVGTEKDSGALFGTQVPWVANVFYQASVRRSGEFSERFGVTWNALVGASAKTMFIKHAKKGFYVPRDAFGAMVLNSPVLGRTLDAMAGLKPGTLMSKTGGLVGERVGPELCFVLLPGTGILPFPDLVIQTRVRFSSAVLEDIRKAVTEANEERTKDELPAAWHEIEVDDRTVFYHDGRTDQARGLGPATYRKAIFIDERTDPKGRSRNYLNIVFTTTDVQEMVRRWAAPVSPKDRVALSASKKVDGQGWLNWRKLYDHVHPWLNLGIAGLDPTAVLASTESVQDHLTDGTLKFDADFRRLLIRHRGPIPLGVAYLPTVLVSTLGADESGSTDLSRERIACDRLKMLHKNAKLFKKDVGRWPARVAELDGYIDFAGNPWVLHLRQSTRSAWRAGFKDLLGGDQEDEDEQEDEYDIDDSIFVITWDGSRWTLGIKPGTLDHLAELYIDQNGKLHRVPKVEEPDSPEEDPSAEKERST